LSRLITELTVLRSCRYQLDHGIETSPGRYDEETRRSLASSLEKLSDPSSPASHGRPTPFVVRSEAAAVESEASAAAADGAAAGDGAVTAVHIEDTDGDCITFALSEDGSRVRLSVNGRTMLDRVAALAADEGSGVVEGQSGSFRIRPDQRSDTLAALRALLARAGVRLSALAPPRGAASGGLPRSPRMTHPSAAAAVSVEEDDGVVAQAMARRAWAELGVAVGPTGRPLGSVRQSSSPTPMADGEGGGLWEEAGAGLEREPSREDGAGGAESSTGGAGWEADQGEGSGRQGPY
jgi:hypothetical protein